MQSKQPDPTRCQHRSQQRRSLQWYQFSCHVPAAAWKEQQDPSRGCPSAEVLFGWPSSTSPSRYSRAHFCGCSLQHSRVCCSLSATWKEGRMVYLLLLMFNPSRFPCWRVLPLCPQAPPVPLDHRLFLRSVLSTLKVMKNQWKIFPQRWLVCRKHFWFIFLPIPQTASFLNGL